MHIGASLSNGSGVGFLELSILQVGTDISQFPRLKDIEGARFSPDDKRLLKIIVGQGNHSTGGEAILQRSVNSHLMKNLYKIEMRGGVILVTPKKGRLK